MTGAVLELRIFVGPLAQKFSSDMSMCISTAQARTKLGLRRVYSAGSRFTSMPWSFLELCPFRVAGVGHPCHLEAPNVSKRRFARQVQDIGRLCKNVEGLRLLAGC